MSGSFRARRPASPSPGPGLPHAGSARFPQPQKDYLTADEKRAAATRGDGYWGKRHPPGGLKISSGEWKLLVLIVLVAAGVRLFRLSRPNSIVFDEVHFGKFASKYIKSQYYVDVHPPLAKLLITLAAFVFGYDGNFDFEKIGKVYEHVPYIAMRMLPATLGLALVPISYLTLRALDCRVTTALLGSLFVTFENGLVTQSRHILLDSPLVFFTGLTTFLWVGFCNEDKYEPFTDRWWTWLTLTGLGLGAVVSCKWVGLFTIATIGFSTIRQLWILLGDLRVSPSLWIKHFMARALCLILVPILFYMAMFEIHFLILTNPGDGDGFMSSAFQHTLRGRNMQDTYADVAVGSVVSIRHVNTNGGYLHSHPHNYPTGSEQQQITLYPHRDSNNEWRLMNASLDHFSDWDYQNHPLQYITDGMQLRLTHTMTDKRLHSHDKRPPVSDVDFQLEVSAYGAPNFEGDGNDNWIVEIEKGASSDKESSKRVKTLRTQFRLRHALQGCYLFSHKVKLPEWGFEQQEVTCNKNAIRANSLWLVETNTHQNLPANAEKVNYKLPGFISKFLELQKVMWVTNAGLTDRHTFDSRPHSWPRLRRGINFWVQNHRQIYLMGNPVIWWLSTLAVVTYISTRGLLLLRAQRGYRDFENTRVVKYDSVCGFLFMGWALHYLPFYLMSRQLFLHHYFPALYFAILLWCATFEMMTSALKSHIRLYVALAIVAIAIWSFAYFSPLVYGLPWTRAKCEKAKWLRTWDFACNDFLEDYTQYSHIPEAIVQPPQTQAVVQGNRGAVVVDPPKFQQNAPPPPQQDDSHTTSLLGNIPQPGVDVFAEKNPINQVDSAEIKRILEEESVADQKEISTVTAGAAQTQAPKLADESAPEVKEEKKPEPESQSSDAKTSETSPELAAANAPPPAKADHPLLPDEQEAEEARKELFPEAYPSL